MGATFAYEDLPSLHSYVEIQPAPLFYDTAFYPYAPSSSDPIFAVTSATCSSLICRPISDPEPHIEVLRSFKDGEVGEQYYALCWSKDLHSGDPLLCLAGVKGKIKVLNVKSGLLHKTLVGHGGAVHSLATHPTNPRFVASGSEDLTVRIWDLDTRNEYFPCVLMCAGGGHRAGILNMCFHPSGHFLLTCGFDHQINLWALPNLPDANTGTDKLTTIHYPHFATTEIHDCFIDSIAFYGNLIVSRAEQENCVHIWRIHGFDTAAVEARGSLRNAPAPTPGHVETRSAFGKGFSILLTLDCKDAQPYYLRFGLFQGQNDRPVLAMGSEKGRVLFWDLQSIEEGDYGPDKHPELKGLAVKSTNNRKGDRAQAPSISQVEDDSEPERKPRTSIGGFFAPLRPHKTLMPTGNPDAVWCKVAWSIDGKWCVAAGSNGLIAAMTRNHSISKTKDQAEERSCAKQ